MRSRLAHRVVLGPARSRPDAKLDAPTDPVRSDPTVTTVRRRMPVYAAASLLAAVASLAVAGPAHAHTGITIEPARAGAANAVATVNAEAESDTAGVTKLQVYLPVGIAPADVTPLRLPKGWTLTRQESSYAVAGPALPVGTDAEHEIRIRRLPQFASITFKVLQSYSDGRTDRWIALPSDDDPEPENPAPTVTLAGGSGTAPASATTPPAPATTPPAPSAAPATAAPSAPAAAPAAEPGGTGWWWAAGAVLLAALVAGTALTLRRRRSSAPPA
jgi:hypothetical protein